MKSSMFLVAVLAVGCSLTSCVSKETATPPNRTATVITRDGNRLTGMVTESSATQIKLSGADGSSHILPMDQVRSIEYDDAPFAVLSSPAAAAPAPEPVPTTAPAPLASPVAPATAQAPPKPLPPHVEHYHPTEAVISTKTYKVPAGAKLSVRTEDTIDSSTAADGQTYSAELTENVLDEEGNIVIPEGSNAQIVIRSANGGGQIQGQSDLVLDLKSVSVGGRRYVVDTVDLERKGNSRVGVNKRTAGYTGTGAAIGAIIGAIAGGGKAAAIGAVSGAGAGAVTQTVTRGKAIRIPVETILTFQLDSPLKIVAR
jgi:hypothetical protein